MPDKHFHDFPPKAAPSPTDLIALEQDPSGTPLMVKTTVSAIITAVGGGSTFDTLADMKADPDLRDRKWVARLGNLSPWDIPYPYPQYIYDASCPDANNDGDRIKPTSTGAGLGCYRQII